MRYARISKCLKTLHDCYRLGTNMLSSMFLHCLQENPKKETHEWLKHGTLVNILDIIRIQNTMIFSEFIRQHILSDNIDNIILRNIWCTSLTLVFCTTLKFLLETFCYLKRDSGWNESTFSFPFLHSVLSSKLLCGIYYSFYILAVP